MSNNVNVNMSNEERIGQPSDVFRTIAKHLSFLILFLLVERL